MNLGVELLDYIMTFWGNLKLLFIIADLLYIPTDDIQGVKFLYTNAWLSGFSLFIFPQKDLIPASRGSRLGSNKNTVGARLFDFENCYIYPNSCEMVLLVFI